MGLLPTVESEAKGNNYLAAIKSLIAIGKVASFVVPLVGNKLAMSTSSDMLEASIGT